MQEDHRKFWSSLPEKLSHPVRVPVVEALWWIGEPLSARATVDVLDGDFTMWDVAHHLRVLETLGVVEAPTTDPDRGASRHESFDVPYRLKARGSGASR
jgi:hypothetical protein